MEPNWEDQQREQQRAEDIADTASQMEDGIRKPAQPVPPAPTPPTPESGRTPEVQQQIEQGLGVGEEDSGRTPEVQRLVEEGLDLSDAEPANPEQLAAGPQAPPHPGAAPVIASLPDTTPQQEAVHQRESGKRDARKQRLGAIAPPDRTQSEGTEQGVRSPGFESIQGANDVAGAMVNYQSQLTSTLTTITKVLLEATSRLEQIEAYFDRLR